MYKVYLRRHDQTVGEKTQTASPAVAEAAYRELMRNREYWCTKSAAVLSLDGRQLEFRRFDRVIPVDDDFRALAQAGRLPDLPKFLYPQDRAIMPDVHNGMIPQELCEYILCSMDGRLIDALILDDQPIRLSHDDPATL